MYVVIVHIQSFKQIGHWYSARRWSSISNRICQWRHKDVYHLYLLLLTVPTFKGAKIFLSESYDTSPLPPLLTSDATHKMVAFSNCGIYCAYPVITCAGISIGGYWGASEGTVERTKELGLQGHRFWNTSTNGKPCGSECPARWRRSFTLLGFGLFTWKLEKRTTEGWIVWHPLYMETWECLLQLQLSR